MKKSITVALTCCLILASCRSDPIKSASETACHYDREQVLGMSEAQFDQDSAGGWRAVSSKPGCNLVAADLLRDYREKHQSKAGLLYWHEAQLRAFAGQSGEAAALMKKAYKPAEADRAGWNLYVDATIAFLRNDLPSLQKARSDLASVPPPVGKDIPPVIDGFMEVEMGDGKKAKIQWPPNIDVVNGLVSCFGKPYGEAYDNECRLRTK